MTKPMRLAPVLAAATLLSACCGPKNLVVVLPGADGHVGSVVVEAAGSKLLLDQAYAGTRPGAAGATVEAVSAYEVERVFSSALGAQPIPPKSYTLYFVSGSGDELIPESKAELEKMLAEMSERKAVEIVITGHTDTVGPAADNDRLSLARAQSVERSLRDTFAAKGVQSDAVTAVGRGERALLVPTPDQTAEPQNRRVEITVR